jgi:uncharacterized protein
MMTMLTKEVTELIQGPAGQLEVILSEPTAPARNAWGIVCHPHPLYGGTMHNKIVTTLAKTFQGMGVPTVRFNFRGVMRSEGQYAQGEGELEDLLAVIDWVQAQQFKTAIWLAGFSFGGYIALKAAAQIPIQKLVTVAPAVQHFPAEALHPVAHPWVLVQGELDDVVLAETVFDWVNTRASQPVVLRFPEAGHFFHGQLTELRHQIQAALL